MHRFVIDPQKIEEGVVVLNAKESRHAMSVLRVKPGEAVELLDGKGSVLRGVVRSIREEGVSVTLDKNTDASLGDSRRIPIEVTLAVSVIKPERMELLVQKATELGVARIVPLVSQHCVVKLSQVRWDVKRDRWQRIAEETCKQCGLAKIPEIAPIQNYEIFMRSLKEAYNTILIPTLAQKGPLVSEALQGKNLQKTLVLIGPEGDFSASEVEFAVKKGALPVSLGPLVLRSETAGIYMLSILNFLSINTLTK